MLLIGLFATYRFYEQVGRSIVKREYSLIRKRMWRFKKLRMFPLEASINIFSDDYNLLQLILHLYFLCYCLLVCLQIKASFTAVFTGHVTYFKTHTLVFFRFTGIKKNNAYVMSTFLNWHYSNHHSKALLIVLTYFLSTYIMVLFKLHEVLVLLLANSFSILKSGNILLYYRFRCCLNFSWILYWISNSMRKISAVIKCFG